MLRVIKHIVHNSADASQIIFKFSKELTESSKESYPKPIYLSVVHWHLLNLNAQFGAGHRVHSHKGIKHNILKLSCEGGVERIGKKIKGKKTLRYQRRKRRCAIPSYILSHFFRALEGGKAKGEAISGQVRSSDFVTST